MARNCLPNNPLKEPKTLLPRSKISSSMNNLSNRTKLACRTCSSSSSFKLEKRQFVYSRYVSHQEQICLCGFFLCALNSTPPLAKKKQHLLEGYIF
ncbi:unnamed protein product [Rotaria magnacalcarata]|uniref:Uncharacterized protein n=1 Tax=Rotaria magnacalcarata TaxID=392030 RepID=A0A816XKT1_9BILA|nr:unnamed protein product [Rotaria magnacalcarata]